MRKRARGLVNELETSLRPVNAEAPLLKERTRKGQRGSGKTSDEREIQRKRYIITNGIPRYRRLHRYWRVTFNCVSILAIVSRSFSRAYIN